MIRWAATVLAAMLIGSLDSAFAADPATNVDTDQVTDTATDQATDAAMLRAAARAFRDVLAPVELDAAQFALDDDIRATWSNLPIVMVPPAGVLLHTLDDRARIAVHDLLRASLSSQGYAKTAAILWLDDVLGELERARLAETPAEARNPIQVAFAGDRSSQNYAVALFGDPDDSSWGWKITGHHLAVNVSVVGDKVAFTPLFVGSNPRVVRSGRYAGWTALPNDGRLGLRLIAALTPVQRREARLAEKPRDVIEGPGRRHSLEQPVGVDVSAFNAQARRRLEDLIDEYLDHARASSAAHLRRAIETGAWSSYRFAFAGDTDNLNDDGEFYFRLHGPRLLIEYSRQDGNHDHAVVRDPLNDYGEDWLGHHYREHHPTPGEAVTDLNRRLSGAP